MCCRILSLACSPSGASFVCSAAAPSLISQVDSSAPDIGSKGTNQVPGKLLLWDTKTMKQQVRSLPRLPVAGALSEGVLPLHPQVRTGLFPFGFGLLGFLTCEKMSKLLVLKSNVPC